MVRHGVAPSPPKSRNREMQVCGRPYNGHKGRDKKQKLVEIPAIQYKKKGFQKDFKKEEFKNVIFLQKNRSEEWGIDLRVFIQV